MSISFSAIMPHAPILIPEVGGSRQKQANLSTTSCQQLSSMMMQNPPDLLILFSPHTPHVKKKPAIRSTLQHQINFQHFGCYKVDFSLPNGYAANKSVFDSVFDNEEYGHLNESELDHGAGVPLYFLNRAGWQGDTIIIGVPLRSIERSKEFADLLFPIITGISGNVALVASADMSHALQPDAPAGYIEEGHLFDRQFSSLLKNGEYDKIAQIDAQLQRMAHQDAMESTVITLRQIEYSNKGQRYFSYEAPFGVGYLVSILYSIHDFT